jgi:hypothetical protein
MRDAKVRPFCKPGRRMNRLLFMRVHYRSSLIWGLIAFSGPSCGLGEPKAEGVAFRTQVMDDH